MTSYTAKQIKDMLEQIAASRKAVGEALRDDMAAIEAKINEAVESGIFADGQPPYVAMLMATAANMRANFPAPIVTDP